MGRPLYFTPVVSIFLLLLLLLLLLLFFLLFSSLNLSGRRSDTREVY